MKSLLTKKLCDIRLHVLRNYAVLSEKKLALPGTAYQLYNTIRRSRGGSFFIADIKMEVGLHCHFEIKVKY